MGIALSIALCAVLAASPATGQEAGSQDYINISYNQVDLSLVARTVGELTGRTFVLDEKVTGKISLVTPPRTTRDVASEGPAGSVASSAL